MILTKDEEAVLRLVLSSLSIKSRTGELGVMHAGRFVSAQGSQTAVLKKEQREVLNAVARKAGIGGVSLIGD